MSKTVLAQGTRLKLTPFDYCLEQWVEAFLIDRKAANLSAGTLHFYRIKLGLFLRFCESQLIGQVEQVDAAALRQYLLWLEGAHNAGGVHACYRAVRAFLRWWAEETEAQDWRNPTHRVKAPKVPQEPLEPVSLETIRALLNACRGERLTDRRDKAILLALLDSGARAAELLGMNVSDLDAAGAILIRQGKGGKPRMVFFGKKTRRAVRAYLIARRDTCPALWITDEGERLCYWGLRSMLKRRSDLAGLEAPKLHAFRRSFAINCLRAGVDVFTLQKLMGHAGLDVLRRYLAQSDQDTAEAHRLASPVDGLL